MYLLTAKCKCAAPSFTPVQCQCHLLQIIYKESLQYFEPKANLLKKEREL